MEAVLLVKLVLVEQEELNEEQIIQQSDVEERVDRRSFGSVGVRTMCPAASHETLQFSTDHC